MLHGVTTIATKQLFPTSAGGFILYFHWGQCAGMSHVCSKNSSFHCQKMFTIPLAWYKQLLTVLQARSPLPTKRTATIVATADVCKEASKAQSPLSRASEVLRVLVPILLPLAPIFMPQTSCILRILRRLVKIAPLAFIRFYITAILRSQGSVTD